MLGSPRILLILRSLTEGNKGQFELRRDAGLPAQSTLRGNLNALEAVGALAKQRHDSFPGTLEYGLTEAGRGLYGVAESTARWLAQAPSGPLDLGTSPARAAIKGLVEGWSATVMTALATGPLSLTQLDKRISTVNYPAIERCLQTMRLAEQLEIGDRSNRGTPYLLTDWLRRGLAPLIVAARWEHLHRPDGVASIARDDIADAVLLSGPLLTLPAATSGICQLAVRAASGKGQQRTLAYLEVLNGDLTFAGIYPDTEPDAWASGTIGTWFGFVIDAETTELRLSGDTDLAHGIFDGIREVLFAGELDRRALWHTRPLPVPKKTD